MTEYSIRTETECEHSLSGLKRVAAGACATMVIISSVATNGERINSRVSVTENAFGGMQLSSCNGYQLKNGSLNFIFEDDPLEDKISSNLQRLDEIAALNDNWNENGAKQFSKEIIQSMKTIVRNVSVQPMIFPTARESIQFEYEKENGDYLEFELFEDKKIKRFFYGSSGETHTDYVKAEEIKEIVNGYMNE